MGTKYKINFIKNDTNYNYESSTINKLSKVSGISISSLYRIRKYPTKYTNNIRKHKYKGYTLTIYNEEIQKIKKKVEQNKKIIKPVNIDNKEDVKILFGGLKFSFNL